jgi:hypothetical protein
MSDMRSIGWTNNRLLLALEMLRKQENLHCQSTPVNLCRRDNSWPPAPHDARVVLCLLR